MACGLPVITNGWGVRDVFKYGEMGFLETMLRRSVVTAAVVAFPIRLICMRGRFSGAG
jgi:hypothetical protein